MVVCYQYFASIFRWIFVRNMTVRRKPNFENLVAFTDIFFPKIIGEYEKLGLASLVGQLYTQTSEKSLITINKGFMLLCKVMKLPI